MDNSVLEIKERIKNKRLHCLKTKKHPQKVKKSYISNLFTRTLLSIILVLICAIYINISDECLINFHDNLFQSTLPFTTINNLYTKYFGNLLPTYNTSPVSSEIQEYNNITNYESSYKVTLNSNTFSFLQSGIIVFIGEKDNLGNTLIVQGTDGVDIWYSNIDAPNLTLYDYVEKDTLIGECLNNEIILTFMKDGNYLSYENYLS